LLSKNIYVNDSQNLAVPTSHFVVPTLKFFFAIVEQALLKSECVPYRN
jgi:hypothetical protein